MSSQKQKLSEMVLQKMREKKQAEQKNRPHFEVLQLEVKFSLQENQYLKSEVKLNTQKLKQQSQQLSMLKQHLQELQNTGKRKYPVIILRPDFIASDNVTIQMKDFYRKTSNTFMKADLIKTQKHQVYNQKQKQIQQQNEQICSLQIMNEDQMNKNMKILQKKRIRNLKQDLLRRKHIAEQNEHENSIQKLTQQNYDLLREYQLKKQNLESRISYNKQLFHKIESKKTKIQQKYNPITYRDYLKRIFDIRIKNEYMQKNLNQVIININDVKKKQQNYRKQLENKCQGLMFYGKVYDSPSKIKGRIQKNLEKEEGKRCRKRPKNITEMMFSELEGRVSQVKSQRQIRSKTSIRDKKTKDNEQNEQVCRKIDKKQSNSNYTSLKTLKNSIKSERTMSTTLKTISTTIKKSSLPHQLY